MTKLYHPNIDKVGVKGKESTRVSACAQEERGERERLTNSENWKSERKSKSVCKNVLGIVQVLKFG